MGRKFSNFLYRFKVYFGIAFTIFFFCLIISHIFINGISSLTLDFVFGIGKLEGESILPAIINTLILIIITLLISTFIGISTAIYLNEYARKNSLFVKIIRLTIESLAGIPSIIYGLFGFLFFVIALKWSWSLLSGAITLSIMVLPTIITSTEEALSTVSDSLREGSYALGVGKLDTIFKIVLPSSISGILVSIVLSIGKIVGETAALTLTAGTVMKIPKSLFNSGASLSVFMYTLTTEGSDFEKAYAVAIILIILVFLINLLSNFIAKKFRNN